ncbi:ATP-dependent DNA helicase Q5 [Blomia tropicalis]|nr:ATP-dependent DNA helicase Q5 [Blomia tropicalis]
MYTDSSAMNNKVPLLKLNHSPTDKARIKNDLMSHCVKTKLLFITPEMATSSSFYSIADHLFRTGQLGRTATDEAHCVFSSQVAYPQLIEELKKFIDILGPKDLIIQRDSNMFAKAKQICNRPELNKMSVGIIYCRTRDECEEIASKLSGSGIRAQPYHAGLTPKKTARMSR